MNCLARQSRSECLSCKHLHSCARFRHQSLSRGIAPARAQAVSVVSFSACQTCSSCRSSLYSISIIGAYGQPEFCRLGHRDPFAEHAPLARDPGTAAKHLRSLPPAKLASQAPSRDTLERRARSAKPAQCDRPGRFGFRPFRIQAAPGAYSRGGQPWPILLDSANVTEIVISGNTAGLPEKNSGHSLRSRIHYVLI
jgi:hypothetical protein